MIVTLITLSNPYSKNQHGGAETSIKLIAEMLALRGHKVYYITQKATLSEKKNAKKANVNLYGLGFKIRGQRFSFVRKLNSLLFVCAVRSFAAISKTDLVYCFYEPLVLKACLGSYFYKARPKVVMRMAGQHWYENIIKNPEFKIKYEKWFSQLDGINFISNKLVSMTDKKIAELDMNINFHHFFTGDIGSSSSFGRLFPYENILNNPFKIIMATRFADYGKRQDILIKAISLLPKGIDVELTLIGGGARKSEMESLVHKLGLEHSVKFKPFVSQQELWYILQNSNILCHSVEYEGLSKIIIESMSLGLPVLASDVEPLNDYIQDNVNGFIVGNDPKAWAKKIVALYNDNALLCDVSKSSIDYVKDNYDPYKNIVLYEEKFNQIMNKY